MVDDLLQKLVDKSISKEKLFKKVENDFSLISVLLDGVSSEKAAIRYGCAKVLMDLSEKHPEKVYPYMDFFIDLLDSKYRILTWNAMITIANLTRVDSDKKFDKFFDKYYSFKDNEYMVTVANLVGSSGKIALAKPYLIDRITNELLKVENLSTTPHLSEECKRVIAEKTIKTFNVFFDRVEDKKRVISFVSKHVNSSRKTLKTEAEEFLKRWN